MLPGELVDEVLTRIGLRERPEATLEGLESVYAAWCDQVPFDNVVKRIHLASGSTSPFPNTEPEAFFDLYLRHGVSGTCWPSTMGLHALLRSLGFDARLASAAMRDDVVGPVHTHGTVLVRAAGREWWVDTSMLSERPIPIERGVETTLDHAFRPVQVEPVDGLWRAYWWRQPFPEIVRCLVLDDDVTADHCCSRYDASRETSPFNTMLHATTMRGGRSRFVAHGQYGEQDAGGLRHEPLDRRVLVDEFGYSEEIVERLPPDDDQRAA